LATTAGPSGVPNPHGAPGWATIDSPGWATAYSQGDLVDDDAGEPRLGAGPVAGAALIDLLSCVALVVGAILVAGEIARGRAGATVAELIGQARSIHYGLIVAIVGAYFIGAWVVLRTSPGRYLLVGRTPDGPAPVLRAVLPAVALLAVAATYTGLTATGPPDLDTSTGTTVGAGPSVTTPASSTVDLARPQAVAVNAVLENSGGSRANFGVALQSVCQSPGGSLATIQTVLAGRESQLARAEVLVVDALPNGAAIRSRLVEALTYSMNADRAYVAYARHVQVEGCWADDNLRDGDNISKDAQAAKDRFVELWNPVATTYGLPARTSSSI
jgi:hypothetical protein